MIISAHQPAYNPWLGYIHKMLISDIFVIMDDVQFEKNSFINRNKILQNKTEIMLTIPVKTKNYKKLLLKNIEIPDDRWKVKHLKSIEQAYRKSQNFDVIYSKIQECFDSDSNYLVAYTNWFVKFLVKYLKLEVEVVFASDLGLSAKKLDYIIELTNKLSGKIFVFGQQGRDYADVELLKQEKINPYFQDYKHPEYTQMQQGFIPYMGIYDLLFNQDRSRVVEIILKNNMTKNELRGLYE